MKIYSLKLKNHLLQSWHTLMYSSLLWISPLYFKMEHGDDRMQFGFFTGLIGFLVVFIPQMILHFRYWLVSKNLTVQLGTKKIVFRQNNEEKTIHVDDVKKIEMHISRAAAMGQMQWYPWDNYGYIRVMLHNGNSYLLTSLLVPGLDFSIPKVKKETIARFVCWPPLN